MEKASRPGGTRGLGPDVGAGGEPDEGPGQVRNSQRPGPRPRKGRGELSTGRRGPGRAAGKEGRGRCPKPPVGPGS